MHFPPQAARIVAGTAGGSRQHHDYYARRTIAAEILVEDMRFEE
jgi:hypothetical protein